MQTLNKRLNVRSRRWISIWGLRRCVRGILLIECLVYLGVVLIVVGTALGAFYKAMEHSRRLRSNVEDVTRALRIGEQWRNDVRSASGPIRVEKGQDAIALCIPKENHEIAYVFSTNQIVRIKSESGLSEKLLSGIKKCFFHQDNRGTITAWRWELEFTGTLKAVRVTPRLTFTAVPTGVRKQ